jgi:hypothetical protein
LEKEAKMKARTICIGLALLLAFGIAVQAFADGGPNPGVPTGLKTIGPKVKGTLIVGWKSTEGDYGQVDAFFYVGGILYASVLKEINPKEDFLMTEPNNVTQYRFPPQIAEDNKILDPAVEVKVLTEKDVVNFTVVNGIVNLGGTSTLSYEHMIYCEAQISFLIPK